MVKPEKPAPMTITLVKGLFSGNAILEKIKWPGELWEKKPKNKR